MKDILAKLAALEGPAKTTLTENSVQEAAKWRQGYSASGHPPGFKHKNGEVGPVGGTYTNEPSGYDGETKKVPVDKYRSQEDQLNGRDLTKLSTGGKPLQPKNAQKNLKAAIIQSKGKHGPVGNLPESEENNRPAFGKRDWEAEAEDKPHDKFLAYKAKGGKLSRSQWEEDRANGAEEVNEMWGDSDHAPDKMSKSAEAKHVAKLKARNMQKKKSAPTNKDNTNKNLDEAPSLAAMGHAAERDFAGSNERQPIQQSPASPQSRKCYIVQKGTNKKIGQGYPDFRAATMARAKMPNPDQYSLVKEDGTRISEKQLTELSKHTLGSYAKKSNAARSNASMDDGKADRRGTGVMKSLDKLAGKKAGTLKGKAVTARWDAAQKSPNAAVSKAKFDKSVDKAVGESRVQRRRSFAIIVEGVKFNVSDSGLAKVLKRFPHEVATFKDGGDMGDHLYDALYDHYCNNGEMPYGTMKARDGDPYEWVSQKLDQELSYDTGLSEGTDNVNPELQSILDKYPHEAKQFTEFGEMDDGPMYEEFYDHYLNAGEMPYGIAKARTGDPVQWVAEQLEKDLGLSDNSAPEFDSARELSSHERFTPEGVAGDIMPEASNFDGDYSDEALGIGADDSDSDEDYTDYSMRQGEMGNPDRMQSLNDESVDPDMDPSDDLLTETDPAEITSTLTELGLDEGLDFFFDGGDLVAIGRSTARVIMNALTASGTASSISNIDGEEVHIKLGNSPDLEEASLGDDFMSMINGMKNKDGSQRFPGARIVTQDQKRQERAELDAKRAADAAARPPSTGPGPDLYGKDGWNSQEQGYGYGRYMGDSKINTKAPLNENVNMNITASGEEDVLGIIRKLSGLSGNAEPEAHSIEAEVIAEPQQMSIRDMMSMLHQDGQDIVDPTGGEIGAGPESVEVEVEEDEYANAPDPSVHTSTTDMINQGNDLNRPKKQFTRAQPGDNPMAAQTPMQETRELLKQYASILKDLRTK